jgi:hypothetical protein
MPWRCVGSMKVGLHIPDHGISGGEWSVYGLTVA